MIVEGINCAYELLTAGYPVEKVIINTELTKKFNDIIMLASKNKVKVEYHKQMIHHLLELRGQWR